MQPVDKQTLGDVYLHAELCGGHHPITYPSQGEVQMLEGVNGNKNQMQYLSI